jgi:hypothetical protein
MFLVHTRSFPLLTCEPLFFHLLSWPNDLSSWFLGTIDNCLQICAASYRGNLLTDLDIVNLQILLVSKANYAHI